MSGVGQGKSSACVLELFMLACRQEPDEHGVRYTKFACVRNTYSQLKMTTIPTVLHWLPQKKKGKGETGIMDMTWDAPIRGLVDIILPDGTSVHSEWLFFSLDTEKGLSNLLGNEITAAWVNELAEIRIPTLLADIYERCRWPQNWTRKVVVADYNPPPLGSWLHELFEKKCPDMWTLYKYPAPVTVVRDPMNPGDPSLYKFIANPDAADDGPNFHKDGVNYWLVSAENRRWQESKLIRFIEGDYPPSAEGRPVHPDFSHRRHVTKQTLRASRAAPIVVGMDCGRTPACCFMQMQGRKLVVLAEIMTEDSDAVQMINDHILPMARGPFYGHQLLVSVDPAAMQRSQVDSSTVFSALAKARLSPVIVDPRNKLSERVGAIDYFLQQAEGFLINEEQAPDTVIALQGDLRWVDNKNVPNARVAIDKSTPRNHLGEAMHYGAMYYRYGGELRLQHGAPSGSSTNPLFSDGDGDVIDVHPTQGGGGFFWA